MTTKKSRLSIIIPSYNEGANIAPMYAQLQKVVKELEQEGLAIELLFVNDGSSDDTLEQLHALANHDARIKVIDLTRNFGKEVATTTGIHYATGDALLMIDADGQHPAELIPEFIKKWQEGAQVVVGVRESNQREGLVKRLGSKWFYSLFNRFTGSELVPGSTDFRLIDRVVQTEFVKMTERNRITRGLIDWLGFKHEYIYFNANERMNGDPTYIIAKLIKLALNSFISLSLAPLYFSIYAGVVILPLSALLGIFSLVEMVIGDPLGLHITGTAFLVILILFLVGILLISQGIMALYLSHIHTETQNRPLFVINKSSSHGITLEEM
jgi:glycosyltransferase involved in cell wall biosynthesis